jgi:hypothetical protein
VYILAYLGDIRAPGKEGHSEEPVSPYQFIFVCLSFTSNAVLSR